MQSTNHWGLELVTNDRERPSWAATLKPPYDPHLQPVSKPGGGVLVIRSSEFDGLSEPKDVFSKGKDLLRLLNTTMEGFTPATSGAVVNFEGEDGPKFFHMIEPIRMKATTVFGVAEITVRDKDGKIIEVPPSASRQQKWMEAAKNNPNIHAAMTHLSGDVDWVELYKVFEALRASGLAKAAISNNEKEHIRRTANSEKRHLRKDAKLVPIPIEDAKSLLRQWLSVAIDEVLAQ